MKKILYLGNHIKKKINYHNAYDTLTLNLNQSGYKVYNASDKNNQFLRLLDMLYNTLLYRNKVDYVLIDTFSTLAFYFAYCNAFLARLLNVPYILILHGGDLPKRLQNSPKMSNFLFNNSYKNIAPSNYLKEAFEKKGFEAEYIPNTISIKDYQYRKRNVLKPNFLFVRALAKIYNPILLIKAFAEVLNEYPSAKLCMIGPDRDGSKSEIESLIEKLQITKQVKITGALDRKEWHKLSEDYDVFINPTTVDNTPVSLIEVAALGLPIITTNVGGIPYLFNKNEVTFFESNDLETLIKKMKLITLESDLYIGKALESRKKVEFFDWEIVKNKWCQILK